jgi:hypothetical protein
VNLARSHLPLAPRRRRQYRRGMPPEPTEQDRRNAEYRRQVAERQLAEYRHAEAIAARALEPGWKPSMKLTVVRMEDCRPTGPNDPAPVPVSVAYRVGYRLMGERMVRYVRELPSGEVLCSENYEDVFQGLLDEKHPTQTMEIKGQRVPVKRFQLYCSSMDVMEPHTAEELADLRASREQKKAERAEA